MRSENRQVVRSLAKREKNAVKSRKATRKSRGGFIGGAIISFINVYNKHVKKHMEEYNYDI
jgi:hypothetical protein